LDLLDLEQVERDRFQTRALYPAPWGMYGGQAAAQARVASVTQEQLFATRRPQ
jgi:acyl-CoA thioesterase